MKNAIAYCAVLAALDAATAMAQSGRGPADPAISGPLLKYESPFATYRPYAEEPLRTWREVNDEVGRVGGHAGVVGSRETATPRDERQQRPSAPADGSSKPATPPPGDGGHRH
jgi:hypothetical protein